jgi:hypothetical protein
MTERYKPLRMWGVMLGDTLCTAICNTRSHARGLAASCRHVRDLRGLSYAVRIVRLEVRIND